MKKKYLLVGIAVVAGIAIIIISLGWPPTSDENAAGAFSKTEKYKKKILADGDLVFNSQLINDTTELDKTIAELIQFGDFAIYTKSTLIIVWKHELNEFKGIPEIQNAINQIDEFTKFIDNNNKSVEKLVLTLVEHRIDSKKSLTADIESQLLQFYNYANQFLLRDSIFESTIGNIDIVVANSKNKANSIAALKALRDRIVLDNFLYGFSIGDSAKVNFSANQKLNTHDKILKLCMGNANGYEYGLFAVHYLQSESFYSSLIKSLETLKFEQNQINSISSALNFAASSIAAVNAGNTAQSTINNNSLNNFGANGPIFYMGNNNYFGFVTNSLNVIFNQDFNKNSLGDKLQEIDPGSFATLGIYLNTENLKIIANKEMVNVIGFENSNVLKMLNQVQLGVLIPNSYGLIQQNFQYTNFYKDEM